MGINKIEDFYNSFNEYSLRLVLDYKDENGRLNKIYFRKAIKIRTETTLQELNRNKNFNDDTKKRLERELFYLENLQIEIINLYKEVDYNKKWKDSNDKDKKRYAKAAITNFQSRLNKIERLFSELDFQKYFISKYIQKENYKTALLLKRYLKEQLEIIISYFNQWYRIDINNSPLKSLFKKQIKNLENSSDEKLIDQLLQMSNSKENKSNNHLDESNIDNSEPQQDFIFKNNLKFDNQKPNDIYNYFKKELVDGDKKYLELETLQNYLKLAFEDMKTPQEKYEFLITTNKIGRIRKIFFNFYKKNDDSHSNKMNYAKLLGDYFNKFNAQKVFNNFDK